MEKMVLPPEEERIRKSKMAVRLSFLFALLDFALIGVIIFEIMKLLNY